MVPFDTYLIDENYIAYVLRSPFIDYVINSVTYGVKMPRVGTDTMTNLLIPLPPLAEQKRIVAKIEELLPYVAYRKAGYSKKVLAEHESEIILHKAAKQFFDEQGLKKLPTVKSLQAEYAQLLSEKKAMYADYQKAREDMRALQTAKANVDRILEDNSLTAERESEKDGR